MRNTCSKHIYLDYNASTPLRPDAWEAMKPILTTQSAAYNASSTHHFGREGRKTIETARTQIAQLIGAHTNQIIFNSGATEGNNTIIRHFANTHPQETILISETEHPSILEALNIFDNIKTVPVDQNGLLRLDVLETLLQNNKTALLSCQYANNETGVIQNIPEIANQAHKHGALFHCDAVQAIGRIPVNMAESGIDFLTLSSHKIGGPQGVGALALGLCTQTPTLLFGGGQEKSARAGTENTAAIAGFGAAAKAALNTPTQTAKLRDKLENRLKAISPDIIIHGENAPRLPNTTLFTPPHANAQSLLMALDLEGLAISNGSACSSGTTKPSTTLKAMGQSEKTASNALRISIGWATTENDIDTFLQIWEKIYTHIKK